MDSAILARVERIERWLARTRQRQCPTCLEYWDESVRGAFYAIAGHERCLPCMRKMLQGMAEDDGKAWDVFLDEGTRKAAMLDLAEVAIRVPILARLADLAMAAVDEPSIALAWTAAKLTISGRY